MGIGGFFRADRASDQEAADTLRFAFDSGMTFVDTAEGYAEGHSEELVGKAIAGRRNEIYVGTKVAPEHLAKRLLLSAAEESLKRLDTDYLDLLQVHWPNPRIPIEETMDGMESLVGSGKVRHIGLCNFSLNQLRDAQKFLQRTAVAAAQVEYNLFDRSVEAEYIPYCLANNIAIIAYSPLDQGHICGGPKGRYRVEPVAERLGCSLAELALTWIVHHEQVLAIPKAAKREHVTQNARAGSLELSADDLATIDRLTAGKLVEVPVDLVRVVPDDAGQRDVYRTVEEARENPKGFTPSPLELADQMRDGDFLKPVRVRPTASGHGYDLIEGRIRYWAWVLAFNGRRDIPVLVRE
jgi:diketogulonate reductase-like aldo/keto reductase